jgi:spermidine synthase
MSLTPTEVMTQRGGVRAARGAVLIGGLGLGWLLRKVCETPEVEKVIVVEISREVLEWYGYGPCARYHKVAEVICDDVFTSR